MQMTRERIIELRIQNQIERINEAFVWMLVCNKISVNGSLLLLFACKRQTTTKKLYDTRHFINYYEYCTNVECFEKKKGTSIMKVPA